MSRPVLHKLNKLLRGVFRAIKFSVHYITEKPDQVDVLPLVESANIVGFTISRFMENQINSPCMINDIKPIPGIFPVAVYGKRFIPEDIIDHQRNELFRELAGPVIIGTVGYYIRQAVGFSISPHKMIGGCL